MAEDVAAVGARAYELGAGGCDADVAHVGRLFANQLRARSVFAYPWLDNCSAVGLFARIRPQACYVTRRSTLDSIGPENRPGQFCSSSLSFALSSSFSSSCSSPLSRCVAYVPL